MAGNRHGRGEGTGSLWHDTLEPDDDARPRPALRGDDAVDVAIVGAGFTGLWTADSLIDRDPSLALPCSSATASFGASGRNGGWCVGDQAAPLPALEHAGGTGAARAWCAPCKVASTSSATWSPPKGSAVAKTAAERGGVTVYEHTTVTGIAPGRVTTTHGTVRADVIVRRPRRTRARSRANAGRHSPSATS